MQGQQHEIRLMWLMLLIIVAMATWWFDLKIISYLCAGALVVSVMHYVNGIDQSTQTLPSSNLAATSKIPLYLCSLLALLGGAFEIKALVFIGMGGWVFFLVRWLQRLERYLLRAQHSEVMPQVEQAVLPIAEQPPLSLGQSMQQWLLKGNPVLQAAVVTLVIGLILLLRFATQHWQLSLAAKLGAIALASGAIVLWGSVLKQHLRSFALALQGLGLAGLCLTLFFAHHQGVLSSLTLASVAFAALMSLSVYLSLRQWSIELAMMTALVAYLAPFTLPQWDSLSLVQLLSYYLLINLAVAGVTSIRAWKSLNHFALLMTIMLTVGYGMFTAVEMNQHVLALLIVAHSAVFIALGYRFSQLLLKQYPQARPLLDLAMIFVPPLAAYSALYLIYFDQPAWQIGYSLGFALAHLGLYRFTQTSVGFLKPSYLTLSLVFLALLLPIGLTGPASAMAWSVQTLLLLCWGLKQQDDVVRRLAMLFAVLAGISTFYHSVEVEQLGLMHWCLALTYLAFIIISHAKASFYQQWRGAGCAFLAFLALAVTPLLWALLQQQFAHLDNAALISALLVTIIYLVMNEALLRVGADWTWHMPKLAASLVLLIGLAVWRIQEVEQLHLFSQITYVLTASLLTLLIIRPYRSVVQEPAWIAPMSVGALALASSALWPSQWLLSAALLPLVWCAYSAWQQRDLAIWQTPSTLILAALWIIALPTLSHEPLDGYVVLLNPSDLISLAMLSALLWMLYMQVKQGVERGLAMVCAVLAVLWVSSYILLRALHVYLGTPIGSMEIWQDATVQLSFTVLWLALSLMTMRIASQKQLKMLWLLGSSLIVLVSFKLVLVDLAQSGTLLRVLSFLAAGGLMLCIAYLAPMPARR